MGEVAHVAEHTAIFGHGLFGGIVGIILSVRTDGGQDTRQNRLRKVFGQIATKTRDRRDTVGRGVGIDTEVVVAFGGIARVAFGALAKTTEEAHDYSEVDIELDEREE